MTDWQPIRVRDVNELLDAIRNRQAEIGMRSAELDQRAKFSDGYADKVLGPSRTKGFGSVVLDRLMRHLAFDLVLVPNPEKLARLGEVVPARKSWDNHRVSKKAMERVKPLVLRDNALLGVEARKRQLTSELRTKIARKAGRASARAKRLRKRIFEAAAKSQPAR